MRLDLGVLVWDLHFRVVPGLLMFVFISISHQNTLALLVSMVCGLCPLCLYWSGPAGSRGGESSLQKGFGLIMLIKKLFCLVVTKSFKEEIVVFGLDCSSCSCCHYIFSGPSFIVVPFLGVFTFQGLHFLVVTRFLMVQVGKGSITCRLKN